MHIGQHVLIRLPPIISNSLFTFFKRYSNGTIRVPEEIFSAKSVQRAFGASFHKLLLRVQTINLTNPLIRRYIPQLPSLNSKSSPKIPLLVIERGGGGEGSPRLSASYLWLNEAQFPHNVSNPEKAVSYLYYRVNYKTQKI